MSGELTARRVGRRWVLQQAGRGVVGFAILGLAACSNESGSDGAGATADPEASGTTPAAEGELSWERVDLDFVAAYVLVRGQEAAVVDTGVSGSAQAIAAVLDTAGPGWEGVRHVILTHKHDDHAGSVGEVLAEARNATGYVGAQDLDAITGAPSLQAVRDGEEVFGLQIVGTPGHTAGHVAIFDEDSGVLVAGDALTNSDDGLSGSNPEYTEDEAAAAASVRKLAELEPRTILVGHGPPLIDDAALALQELADRLR